MEKYLYLTPDEYEAMVCISGQTPVTCFSKMKYLEIEDRRNRLLTLYNKGFVVNTGEAFVINAEWKDAFACIHSAKSALHITAGNPEVPDLLVYVGKYIDENRVKLSTFILGTGCPGANAGRQ